MTTPLRIEITDDARAQIAAAAAAWWAENRPSAPGAILQDLDRILGLLAHAKRKQMARFRAYQAPLLPVAHAHTSAQPLVDLGYTSLASDGDKRHTVP